ncbi:MAG TPA: PLP-dependent aminotransferase family protein [Gemmatimonadaceae bacterium]|nr:PLP-dependent aminotransferase family protein [Gemmatimonadaceae bacterium]
MPKQPSSFALALPPRDHDAPAAQWLCGALRDEILDGRLRPGSRLPSTRDLARQQGLSRGTVVSAFDQLRAEGYVQGSTGSGTYVSKVLPDELLQVRPRRAAPRELAVAPPRRRLAGFAMAATIFPGLAPVPTRAFRTHLPALDLFPTSLWAQLAGRRLRRATTGLLLGSEPMGYRPLQSAVAEYLVASRGVKCVPEQVAIVSGTQEALDLAAHLFLDPGDRVCVENPGYAGARRAFEAVGARVTAIDVDEDGATVPPARLTDVRLAYLTPGHQFPLGMCMSLSRRLAMLEWARRTGAILFEDDYDSEYRYAGKPVPALQGLDRHGVVLFAGSFSKVLFPGLRLGYVIVPPDLVERVTAVQSIRTRHPPMLTQAVLCDFIAQGHFARHVRRMREVYAERLGALLDAARERLAGALVITGVEAGLQTAAWLIAGHDAAEVEARAAERDVDVTALDRYTKGRTRRQGLHLGFAAVDVTEIRRGVRELASVLEEFGRGRRRR